LEAALYAFDFEIYMFSFLATWDMTELLCSLFGSSSQPTVFFSHIAPVPATSQPTVFFSHTTPAPAQRTE